MKAHELMSTNVVAVPPETPVAAVAELLAARGISAVPVIDAKGRPLGLVTESDLIRRLADRQAGAMKFFLRLFADRKPQIERFAKVHGATAADVMSAKLISAAEDDSAERIAGLMETHQIRRVPILKDGRLLGIVSRADLLRAILRSPDHAATVQGDAAIQHALTVAMREQPWADSFWVFPSVLAGVVTFYGYARSDAVRGGLAILARGIDGVKSVTDLMTPMPLILRATL